ncbi:MAG: aminotransferase class V-fold PLP-dependent enzyme [Gemmatimonadales bacterium]|nr:aminotransferase class V-fold PLP-dependent enzyme [Gemmatimonadales bacterium]
MINRREFTIGSAGAIAALATGSDASASVVANGKVPVSTCLSSELAERYGAVPPDVLADDEPFWARVRSGYTLHPTVLNLDNGWTNPTPQASIDKLISGMKDLEALPAEHLLRMWEEVTTTTFRTALAEIMGVPGSEIALVRNATEALDTVLLGLPMEAGDEVVCSTHDYYAMLDALEQRRDRDGVVLRMISLPAPAPSLDALAEAYEAAMGPRTKLVLLTHPSNLTGQLLPVERIADAARRVGAEVVVDGAQSLGLLDAAVPSLGCDYYGASTHKWLGTPVGTGVLWMRPAHVGKVWPLVPPGPSATGMGRFEWIGTAPAYIEPAALPALALHRSLGAARKAARLRYLAAHLRTRVAQSMPDARFLTLADTELSVGLTTIQLPNVDPSALQTHLRNGHNILTQAMVDNARAPEVAGLRVSPNVYNTPTELNRLVDAMTSYVRSSAR